MNKRFNLFVVQKRMPAVRRQAALGVLFAFLVNTILGPVSSAFAQAALPLPATMVNLSAGYSPTLIKGMRVYPENPLRFDFIVDAGDSGLQGSDLEEESSKLMKYFLSSLTVPEKDLWVNLSPYEKDRIIPDAFGKTEMGRDMLGQDYILKQLTSSLIYPESELGKSFWAMAYQKAYEAFGSTDIPVNTFNKIWIVPQKAVVFAKDNIAYVAETHLQVMLEEDYVALANQKDPTLAKAKDANAVGSQIVREIILPAIEKEVNEGRNFAPLRQVYNSLILATWYKRNLKESILGKVYIGQNKIDGVTFTGDTNKERIYQDYLEAFQKGVYNYIREEEDRFTQEMVPRKYFSGGVEFAQKIEAVLVQTGDERVVGGSAVVASKQSLFAVELGRAKPAPVEVAAAGASSAALDFSVRDVVRTGAKPVLFSGRYDRGEINRGDNGSLTSTGGIEDQARNFKQAVATVAAQSANPLATLKAMEPLVRYLLDRTIKEKNYTADERSNLRWEELGLQNELAKNPTAELNVALEAVRLKIQKAVFIQKMSKVLDGRSYTTTEMQELLNIVATLINDLPDQEVLRLLAATQERVKNFLYVKSAKIADWNTVEVRLVLNGGDVFEIEKLDDGQAVLNVDFSSFVKSLSAAQVLSWDYNFSDSDFRQSQVADVEKFAQAPATKNVFIAKMPRLLRRFCGL
jgi:hypothetical protein